MVGSCCRFLQQEQAALIGAFFGWTGRLPSCVSREKESKSQLEKGFQVGLEALFRSFLSPCQCLLAHKRALEKSGSFFFVVERLSASSQKNLFLKRQAGGLLT